ncbi:MAG: SAM-dependent methyltransferase [Selenomonadaceae bacterium]|nr:SAM-dependent methyltransferase [Selenomonadaceae bacterium]
MIDSRIKAVLNFVRRGSRVADVGADHGYLSLELINSGRASRVIATEKNQHPFEALSKNISGVAGIEARLGDGLQVLTAGEVDTICIAGMGGALIAKILGEAPEVVQASRQLILQPMNGADKVRDWLARNDWTIADEDLAESAGIIYEIICAERNSTAETFRRESSPLRKKFSAQRLKKLQRVLDEMSKSPSARASEKFSALQAEVDALKNHSQENIMTKLKEVQI